MRAIKNCHIVKEMELEYRIEWEKKKMICAEEIGYEYEMEENTSIERIRNRHSDGIILWIKGSGRSPEGKSGKYRCVLEYKGHT